MTISAKRQLRRFQIQWRPTFTTIRGGVPGSRIYVLGEKSKYIGSSENPEETIQTPEELSYDHRTFSLPEILRVAHNSILILPLNTSVALAQEYTPQVRNKLVQYNTLGGNMVATFGQAIKSIGLRIRIIRAGRKWETYHKGLEAIAYLSANQGRFYGSVYLLSFDQFADGTEALVGRYKVVIESLDFQFRSDQNTTINADMRMFVTHDYGHTLSEKHKIWGSL